MAEVVAISLQVDSGQSVQEVKKLEDAIKEVNNTSSSLSVDEKFKTLNSTLDTTTATFGEMSQAIEAYKTIALNAGRESPIGQEALKRASQLKDRITDLDREVDNLAMDSRSLQTALQISSGVIAGYQAFTSVTALLGVENEELLKTMVKLQSAMSLLQAIEQIRQTTEKESLAMKALDIAQTKVLIGLKKAYAFAIGTGTKSMKLFRGALIATGLGALVVLLGTIIAKWDDWKDTIMKFINTAFAPFIVVLKYLGVIESDLEKARRINSENQVNRLQRESDKLDENTAKENKRLSNEIEVAKARGENTRQLELDLLKAERKGAFERLRIAQALYTSKLKLDKDLSDEEKQKIQDKIDEEQKAFDDITQRLKVFKAQEFKIESDSQKAKSDQAKANKEKRKQEIEKANEEELRLVKERLDRELSMIAEIEDAIINGMQDEDAKKLAQLKLQQERELDAVREKYGLETELEAQLLRNQAEELKQVKKEIADQEIQELQELADSEDEEDSPKIEQFKRDSALELEILKEKFQAGLISEEEYNEGLKTIAEARHQSRVAGLNATGDVLNALGGLFDKNEKVQKATALAQIGIDTAKAISSLVANSQANPTNAVTGGVSGAIQFATGLAQILSNIGKAKQLLGASGGSGVTPPTINRPSNLIPTNTVDNSGGNTNTNRNVPTTKVVLVESELQAMQTRRNEVDRIATI